VAGFDWVLYYPSYFLRGFAVHGYPDVPPYPASHGCARIPMWIARTVYDALPDGATVYVYAYATVSATRRAHSSTASQSRASEAGMRLNGKRSFDGSIAPPNTVTSAGSTPSSPASAASSCARELAMSAGSSVRGPSANTATGRPRRAWALRRRNRIASRFHFPA